MLYRYKLQYADGSDAGEAHYAVMVGPGEEIQTGDGRKLRVLALLPADDGARHVGLLKVEAARA